MVSVSGLGNSARSLNSLVEVTNEFRLRMMLFGIGHPEL
jgi:hypothetical protein